MRLAFIVTMCFLVSPLRAETIMAQSRITDVTVYPQGARLTRLVEFTASAGVHDLLITDLPAGTDPQSLRLVPAEGIQIGAYALRRDRLPPRDVVKSPALLAAEADLEAAEGGVNAAQLALDAVTARIEAAKAQIAYLGRLGATDAKAETEVLQATARMIGAEVLAASQTALAARADLPAAEKALKTTVEARAKAQAALDALGKPAEDYAALSLALSVAAAGPAFVEMTQFVGAAGWSPLYDIGLDSKAGQVVLDRSFLVSQNTGEDWAGVALTLSTAQPGNAPDPTQLWPQLHRIEDPRTQSLSRMADAEMGGLATPAPMAEEAVFAKVTAQFQGDIVVYPYPNPVDVADGAEDLRLALDRVTLPAEAQATAVPRYDATAFMIAELTNDSGQILLPGPATLTRDGAMIGAAMLETIAPGAKAKLGFGAIEGLRLKRSIPARAEGDRGIFSKSNQIEETAILSVENLTDAEWRVRVLEVIPYSEQEELIITFTADPPVTEQDADDKRGVLAWNLNIPAGTSQEITLSTRESWPEGKELQAGRY
jgi:uncharacterized protein (TIGR02231 family)